MLLIGGMSFRGRSFARAFKPRHPRRSLFIVHWSLFTGVFAGISMQVRARTEEKTIMATGTVMEKSVVDDTPVLTGDKGVSATHVSRIRPRVGRVLLLIGASLALSATATGMALAIAHREALGEQLRLISARTSQGIVQFTRACTQSAQRLTARASQS